MIKQLQAVIKDLRFWVDEEYKVVDDQVFVSYKLSVPELGLYHSKGPRNMGAAFEKEVFNTFRRAIQKMYPIFSKREADDVDTYTYEFIYGGSLYEVTVFFFSKTDIRLVSVHAKVNAVTTNSVKIIPDGKFYLFGTSDETAEEVFDALKNHL